jgi:serine O-acetyltransferase
MHWNECKSLIKSDLSRLSGGRNFSKLVRYLLTNASIKILFYYRMVQWLRHKRGGWKILYLICLLRYKHNQWQTGIQLPLDTTCGKGLLFAHYGCIVINGRAVIGDECTIFQGVTIGSVRGPEGGTPVIGNHVVLGAGCKIIGNVRIGNDVFIGAGAVVTNDIPDGAVAVGVPARVISMNGGKNTQYYY